MFINKINGLNNSQSFKGYQHKVDEYGSKVMEFNFPYDHTKEDCYVEIYKVKRNDKALGGYDVLEDKCLIREKLSPNGTIIDIQDKTNLAPDEAFAYRFVKESFEDGQQTKIADTGIKLYKDGARNTFGFDHDPAGGREYLYTLVSRKGTTPLVQGPGLAVFPDSLPGFKIKGFRNINTGDVIYDQQKQKDATEIMRTYSNKFGGSIAGLIAMVDYMEDDYLTLFSNPFANGDNLSSHHYWNKNNFRISRDMGSVNDFRKLASTLFQNGKRLIFDYTFMGEGLEGINFQHAMRWKGHETDSQYLFRMNENVSYGVIPRNHENLRFKVVNPMEIYYQGDDGSITIKTNRNYNPNKETYFQIYDNSQVSDEQRKDLTKIIRVYDNIETKDELAINSHDDTIVPFAFEINPKEYGERLRVVKDLIDNNGLKVRLDSAEGTKLIAQFDNLKLGPKVETGTVNFDANTDLIKKRHDVSSYDERDLLSIGDENARSAKRERQYIGANQASSMDNQAVKYWMQLYKDANIIYTAKTLGSTSSERGIQDLIDKGALPKHAKLSETVINNIKEYEYFLKPKGNFDRETVTVKNLMELPLDSLELAENTLGVLARPYFSSRAKDEDQIRLSRFELMEMGNPHLTEQSASTYLKMNDLYINELKNFADEVINTVNETSKEKLIDESGEYTEYGEYVIELLGKDIARYAFLKAIAGNNLESKIRNDGFIEYDVEKLEDTTSLKGLGIQATNPDEEAAKLEQFINTGIQHLSEKDVKYVAASISKIIEGTNTMSFELAEAMVNKSGLGMAGRLDAAKDMVDNDSVRDSGNSMDDSLDKLVPFYRNLIETVKSVDSTVPIIAEITDMGILFNSNYNENSQVYGNELMAAGGKYINVPDAMVKFYNETGLTSEAAYSYLFTDFVRDFTYDFEQGYASSGETNANGDVKYPNIKGKISELLRTRNIDYIKNLYTFLSNHDKPRILQGLALSQPLFYTDFKYDYPNGVANFATKRNHREAAAMILNGVSSIEELPIEAKLNLDNPNYFKRVSTEALSMADFIRKSVKKNLQGVVPNEQLKEFNLALKDLSNGVYLGKGEVDELQDISIPELSSLRAAFEAMVKNAEEKHALKLTPEQKTEFINATLELANKNEYLEPFVMRGDFNWTEPNNEIGKNNRLLAQTILEKGEGISEAGVEKATKNPEAYNQYSLYTTNLIGLLRNAMFNTEIGKDPVVKSNMFAAMKDFLEQYDRNTVEASKNRKLFVDNAQAVKANAFAAKEIRTAIRMVLKQVEYRTGKKIENKEKIVDSIYIPAIQPAADMLATMTKFMAALVGSFYVNLGDDLLMSGGERKARNLDLQNRNAIPLHLLNENNGMGELTRNSLTKTKEALSILNHPDTESLNDGTPYELNVKAGGSELPAGDRYLPAYLTQSSNGSANIVIMDLAGLRRKSEDDYDKVLEPKPTEIDCIEFTGGVAFAAGTVFVNIDPHDTAKYIVEYKDKVCRLVKEGIKDEAKKILFDKNTADKNVMILRKIPSFKGRNNNLPRTINSRYNFVSNPYKKTEAPVQGENLSLISR